MELPRDKFGRLACVIAGLFFGVCASSLLGTLLLNGRLQLDRLWFVELILMFAVFGWGLFIWGIAMPPWIDRVVQRATMYIMLAVMILFLPIAFEFFMLCFQGAI